FESDRDTGSFADAYSDTDSLSDGDARSFSNANSYSDTNADSNSNSNGHSHANPRHDSYADGDAKEEISERPSSASFAYANYLIASSTADAAKHWLLMLAKRCYLRSRCA